ncbi:hypothetical protein [Allocoleopsis sp.]|uniref:hypothetical protein n=1 Tax=Allocoleopsis sp. TaxID=3088169 RepID=UPI002FD6678E
MTKPQPTTRLINLPTRIAKIERELLSMRTEIKKLYEKRDRLALPIERVVVFDLSQECKNKEQRDVRKAQLLLEDEEYQETLRLIGEQEFKVAETEIQLRQLERQYSTEKLIARWVLGFQYSTISQMFDIDDVTVNNGSDCV